MLLFLMSIFQSIPTLKGLSKSIAFFTFSLIFGANKVRISDKDLNLKSGLKAFRNYLNTQLKYTP